MKLVSCLKNILRFPFALLHFFHVLSLFYFSYISVDVLLVTGSSPFSQLVALRCHFVEILLTELSATLPCFNSSTAHTTALVDHTAKDHTDQLIQRTRANSPLAASASNSRPAKAQMSNKLRCSKRRKLKANSKHMYWPRADAGTVAGDHNC